jgi:hypothetical protein
MWPFSGLHDLATKEFLHTTLLLVGIGERLIRMSMSHPQVATRSSLMLVYPQDDRIVAHQLLHLQSKDKQHENPTQNIVSVGMEQC